MNRRQFLESSLAAGAALAAGPVLTRAAVDQHPVAVADPSWLSALGQNAQDDQDYYPEIDGDLPFDLSGTLYRNGPGLFERDGYRKQHLLDGDGLIQAFDIDAGRVRYRNHFVRTPKFIEEEQAGQFLHPTWPTLAPHWWQNLPGFPTRSQAGITPVVHHGKLFAFDEVGNPVELDPASLIDKGEHILVDNSPGGYKAHTKIDGRNGDWIVLGLTTGRKTTLEPLIFDRHGKLKSRAVYPAPRQTYIHDFFVTANHIIVNLHAITVSPFAMLAGLKSFTDSFEWDPGQGNLVMVIDKSGKAEPQLFEAPASFMWHSFNAYQQGNTIIADFIGYDEPDHFIGEEPVFKTIMNGREVAARNPGLFRRYEIDLASKRLREDVVSAGHYEFPMIHPGHASHEYRYAYACVGDVSKSFFHDGVIGIDVLSGRVDEYRFGAGTYVSEPVFAPRPGSTEEQSGWLLSIVLDQASGHSRLAVFDSQDIAAGPVALVKLNHATPLSFHGTWKAA